MLVSLAASESPNRIIPTESCSDTELLHLHRCLALLRSPRAHSMYCTAVVLTYLIDPRPQCLARRMAPSVSTYHASTESFDDSRSVHDSGIPSPASLGACGHEHMAIPIPLRSMPAACPYAKHMRPAPQPSLRPYQRRRIHTAVADALDTAVADAFRPPWLTLARWRGVWPCFRPCRCPPCRPFSCRPFSGRGRALVGIA